MESLDIEDKINKSSSELKDAFLKSTESKLHIKTDYEKKDIDYSWVPIFENSCYYIDNILRNPKKFIVNEEEIVKIEQAKKVTVETVIHLTQHTNFIQKFDPKTMEVTPTKVLNINKEESLDTYENKFIYTVIKLMDEFIERHVSAEPEESFCFDEKKIEFNGESKVGTEKVNISLKMFSSNNSTSKEKVVNGMSLSDRIKKIKVQLAGFKETELYKSLAKAHTSLVRPPIRRTNVILKNPNFQKAMELWNFLQEYTGDGFSLVKDNQDYIETGYIKDEFNETFLINYLTLTSLSRADNKSETSKSFASLTVNKIISSIIDSDEETNKDEILTLVSKEFDKATSDISKRDTKIKEILNNKLDDFNEYMIKSINSLN